MAGTPSGTEKKFRNNRVLLREVVFASGVSIYSGTAVTRAAARAAAGDGAAIGSLFIAPAAVATTKPNLYVKTANAASDNDWERLVTQASD